MRTEDADGVDEWEERRESEVGLAADEVHGSLWKNIYSGAYYMPQTTTSRVSVRMTSHILYIVTCCGTLGGRDGGRETCTGTASEADEMRAQSDGDVQGRASEAQERGRSWRAWEASECVRGEPSGHRARTSTGLGCSQQSAGS